MSAPPPIAQSPTYRPMWVLVLTSAMLLAGGYSMVAGLLKLRDPTVVLAVGMGDVAASDSDVALKKALNQARAAAVAPHHKAIQAEAIAEIALALFALYGTAAVLSRDRHGRALVIWVAVLAIVYQLATLPVYLSLMRDYVDRSGTLLARAVLDANNAVGAQGGDVSAEELAQRLRSGIVAGTVAMTLAAVVGALILLAYFGGRRGRALYGVDGNLDATIGGSSPPLP